MQKNFSKKDCVNEILRLTKNLCQMKHDDESDRQLKQLIQENFAYIAEIEMQEQQKRELKKERNLQIKLSACAGG